MNRTQANTQTNPQAGPHAGPRAPAIPTQELLALLADTDCSFTEVAQRCAISVQELSLYLTSDEGRELFMAAHCAAMMRVRMAAVSNLNHAVSALSLMLMAYQSESETLFRDSPPTRKFREVQRTNARRAASLLTRLANLQYRPLIATPTPTPTPTRSPTPSEASSADATADTTTSTDRAPSPSTPVDGPSPSPCPGASPSQAVEARPTTPPVPDQVAVRIRPRPDSTSRTPRAHPTSLSPNQALTLAAAPTCRSP